MKRYMKRKSLLFNLIFNVISIIEFYFGDRPYELSRSRGPYTFHNCDHLPIIMSLLEIMCTAMKERRRVLFRTVYCIKPHLNMPIIYLSICHSERFFYQ